jgi:type IV pilus assembly protein PilA
MIRTINTAMAQRRAELRNGENDKGFTLIELMVVIIIIGILAAIAIPVFLNQRQAAWDGSAKSDLANLAIAAESYSVANNGSYKDMTIDLLKSGQGLKTSSDNTLSLTVGADNTSYTATAYNNNSGATGHTFTSTSGTITGPK